MGRQQAKRLDQGQRGGNRGCENRERDHTRAVTDDAVGVQQASTTCDSTMALATEKDDVRSRLGELHRLLNNRKGSLSATKKKNAGANDSCDMNQKTIQALDTLAEEYGVFEATMKKVAFEHEEGMCYTGCCGELYFRYLSKVFLCPPGPRRIISSNHLKISNILRVLISNEVNG